jgi:hypothetical protein
LRNNDSYCDRMALARLFFEKQSSIELIITDTA